MLELNDNAESILSDLREVIYDYSERTSLVPSEFAQSLEQEGILELYRSVDFQSFEEYRTRRKGSGSKTYRRSYTFSDGEGTGGLSDETGSYVDNGEYSNDSRPQNILDNEEPNFALRAPVEETKDLIAVHNATEDNIKGLLDLKGFPMPSIAIIKAAQGHNDYGPYSFVFDKSTIDPQAKLYYTPFSSHVRTRYLVCFRESTAISINLF